MGFITLSVRVEKSYVADILREVIFPLIPELDIVHAETREKPKPITMSPEGAVEILNGKSVKLYPSKFAEDNELDEFTGRLLIGLSVEHLLNQ